MPTTTTTTTTTTHPTTTERKKRRVQRVTRERHGAPALAGDISPDSSPTLAHVHETTESVALVEMTPAHPPREDTPEYRQTHQLLVFEKDTPCRVCGVRHSDLQDPARAADPKVNRDGATALETHHYPCERSLLFALDWRKVHAAFPAVYSQASLELWVDSPENMLVLCDVHHRSPEKGIHHLLTQDFAVMPFLVDGYQVAATARDAAAVIARDEAVERASGLEARADGEWKPTIVTVTPDAIPDTLSTTIINAAAATTPADAGGPPPAASKPEGAPGTTRARARRPSPSSSPSKSSPSSRREKARDAR